ncbi:MAG: prephenate dehydrogenase/arogenate dehydrogenase family protein [Planctomycetes bacterium]|nr:prephenate dehydrogenase/arogenate dehydrogenase family protein [Planctomycetota bacterium]
MRICTMSPAGHDRVLARISHLPHILAMALINCSDSRQMLLCGKGFLDTTRIASGPPGMWRDILTANAGHTAAAIGKLINELTRVQENLELGKDQAILKMLTKAQVRRDELVEQKLIRKELPT